MQILILANKVPYPPKDGGAIATLSLSAALAKAGAHVKMLAINTPKHFCPDSHIPQWIKAELNLESIYVDTNIKPYKALWNLLFSQLPYNAERFVSNSLSTRLEQVLKEDHYDIVQLEGLYLAPYIDIIRKHSNAKIALRAHNVEHEIWQRTLNSTKSLLKRLYIQIIEKRLRRMEQEALQQVDLLIPISKRDEESLINMGCTAPSLTIPFGIDPSNFNQVEDKYQDASPRVFHLGGLDWQPNQDGIIWFITECWPLIKSKIPAATFTIAGRNAPKHFLNQIKGDGISYIGEVDNAMQFIANAGVMVVPLRIGSGMRIKIIEGMAIGKAIVSTTIGAEGIDYSNGTSIMIGDSPSEFANATIQLLNNPAQQQSIGKAAKEMALQRYSIHNQCLMLLNFYKKSMIEINPKP